MSDERSVPNEVPCLAQDILRGAEEISAFVYGDIKFRRRVYHLCESSNLPHFRLGSMLCARKSTLVAWIEKQEQKANA